MMENVSGKAHIELWDDGDGFGKADLNEIFEFSSATQAEQE